MRRVLMAALSGVACLVAFPAWADSSRLQGGGLGGGLFEALVTGGRPDTTTVQPRVQTPGAVGAQYIAPEVVYADPQAAPRQMASIAPQEPTEVNREVPPEFLRQEVAYDGRERPGTIIVDTPNKYLFFVEPGGRAMRYGIGVGRPGFEWSGVKSVTRKAEWPDWTPPPEMLLRRPDLPRHMDGGPGNPLGARALYLGSSMYRIHGTNEPWTIGQNVSSGCIRMMNDDVIDLYERAKVGTKVIVM
jgi:lipoprotein-anchoring transpeptidase ErfK/SrfK